MKIDIKKKFNIKEIIKNSRGKHLRRRSAGSAEGTADSFSEEDSFGAMVHSSAPILRLKDQKEESAWKQDLFLNLSCAALMTTAIALFCMCIDTPILILCALPCFVMYMAIAVLGAVKPGPVKWITAGVILVILIAVAAVWHEYVLGGLSMLINQFYDVAEEAQAYLYKRLPGGDASEAAGFIGLAWISCFIGLVFALPPAEARRKVSGLVVITIMLAFAYYGLIPSAICIAVMIAVMIAAVSRGNLLSLVPVVLVALILFGAIVLIDPGENYGISRMDENFRDRFALKSAQIQTEDPFYDEEEEMDTEEEEEYEEEDYEDEEYEGEYGTYAVLGFIILGVLAIGAAAYLLHRRISRRIAENRKGIDSKDTREAVTAMFPYSLRWLKGYGIEQPSASVTSMIPALTDEFSDSYAKQFRDMYIVWSEAAYSDHEVSEDARLLMDVFMNDTIKQIKDRCRLRDRLKLRFRHAL